MGVLQNDGPGDNTGNDMCPDQDEELATEDELGKYMCTISRALHSIFYMIKVNKP